MEVVPKRRKHGSINRGIVATAELQAAVRVRRHNSRGSRNANRRRGRGARRLRLARKRRPRVPLHPARAAVVAAETMAAAANVAAVERAVGVIANRD